jgi:hypothetical protein
MPKTIETTAHMTATPEQVWDVLTDFGSFGEWNPFIVAAGGELTPGSRLELQMRLEGSGARTFRPRVLTVEPGRELRWKGRLPVPGLFAGEHYFLLEPDGAHTLLRHGERFDGLLVPFTGTLFTRTRRAFEAMNAALARRVGNVPDDKDPEATAQR